MENIGAPPVSYGPIMNTKRANDLPIVHVAKDMGMELVCSGHSLILKDEGQMTSLSICEKGNYWKRFSGKEKGGVSKGGVINLVMHWQDIDFKGAMQYLHTRYSI